MEPVLSEVEGRSGMREIAAPSSRIPLRFIRATLAKAIKKEMGEFVYPKRVKHG